MNIPQGLLEIIVVGVVGFVFKVVFGLISKNEIKSDESDRRLHSEIKNVSREMKDVEGRFRNNDRELYSSMADVRERVTRVEERTK